MINLYPWNYYILYAAIAAVIIMILALIKPLSALLKAVKSMEPDLNAISKNADAFSTKSIAAGNTIKNTGKTLKTAVTVALILNAIRRNYTSEDEAKGIKGVSSAAVKTARQEINKNDLELARRISKISI
ncbi:MAG: hypothetical protein IKE28_07055 [Solobacterium sp.]|nr:hypothetical protein [Solobacterium sp.]